MTDYTKLVKALRLCGKDLMHGERCKDSCPYGDIALCIPKLKLDAAAAIEGLQSGVERLKDVIGELREAQTYIDRYGDKWMTSAKDVPTSAYQHGYADGFAEAMAKMGVQDEGTGSL